MMHEGHILIVEDEQHIAELLILNLEMDNYQVSHTPYTKKAIELIDSDASYDLIIMDVMLPDGNGIDACHSIKLKKPDIPILMLSALGQSTDKIRGLKAGADDYLAKPFNLEELLLRVQKLIKRYDAEAPTVYELGTVKIDLQALVITNNDTVYNLSANEAKLIAYLLLKKDTVVSRHEIIDNVWGITNSPNPRTIDNFISNFRKIIEEEPSTPQYIKTVRGVGYTLCTTP